MCCLAMRDDHASFAQFVCLPDFGCGGRIDMRTAHKKYKYPETDKRNIVCRECGGFRTDPPNYGRAYHTQR